jgi:putative transposase
VIGLYKTELIMPPGPWRTAGQVEPATLDYVNWYNHRPLYETCEDIPPAELEAAYYRQSTSLAEAGLAGPRRDHRPAHGAEFLQEFPDDILYYWRYARR